MKDLFRRRKSNVSKMTSKEDLEGQSDRETGSGETATEAVGPSIDSADTKKGVDTPRQENIDAEAELDILRTEHQALHDKHLRLFAEFDNFRKRTARERIELLQHAGESTLKAILPVLDDMARAIANNEAVQEATPIKEGMQLIHQKMLHVLGSQGLKPMEVKKGDAFDTDRHEAITQAPAETPELKGAVIDVVENGYTLHDKVIRFAKVVVGE